MRVVNVRFFKSYMEILFFFIIPVVTQNAPLTEGYRCVFRNSECKSFPMYRQFFYYSLYELAVNSR